MGVNENFEMFISYINKFINRDGKEKFLEWLLTTDIMYAPASTQYHLSQDGGLVVHSMNVMKRLIKLINMEYGSIEKSPFSRETIVFVSLLHDIAKTNFYEKYSKNVRNQENGQWEQFISYKVKEPKNRLQFGSVGENSVYILQKFFDVSIEEASAIKWAEGYSKSNDTATISAVYNLYGTSRLAVLLHLADMLAICIDESQNFPLVDVEIPQKEEQYDEQDSLKPTPETSDCPF